ncbi:MAG: hypothetical protein AAF597_10030, partial [Bacteroidota bacterium]
MTYQPETFTASLTATIEDVTLQYALTLDTRGIIHQIDSPFFDLPPAAQKLTIGTGSFEIIEKIKNRGALFQYELLLALSENKTDLSEQIKALADTIEAKLKANSMSWAKFTIVKKRFDVVDWFKTGLSMHVDARNGLSPEKFLLHLTLLTPSSENITRRPQAPYDAMRFFGYYGGDHGHDFLALLIPFYTGNTRRVLLEAFKHEQRAANKAILLRQLEIPNNGVWVGGALDALKKYRDSAIAWAAIALFHREENLSEDALANLAKVLGAYPSSAAGINVLQTILRKRLRHSSG